MLNSIKPIQFRRHLIHTLTLVMLAIVALMILEGFKCITGTETPVGIMISGSMEPALKRGDMMFTYLSKKPIRVGEIVSFKVEGEPFPIVHRVIKVHKNQNTGEVGILTKGDDNSVDDTFLYDRGQKWLKQDQITGRVFGIIPYVGWVFILMTENRIIKYIILGSMGLLAIDALWG